MEYIVLFFVLAYGAIVLIGEFYFYFSPDAATNRIAWKWWNIIGSAVSVTSATIALITTQPDFSLAWLFLFIPLGCLAAYLQIKNTRFCDNCGRKVSSLLDNVLVPAEFCPRCGAKLRP